jgi:hypothetical protein
VKITTKPGETFIDRMIALVEGAARQKTPNEIALNILLAGMTIIFVFATVTIPSYAAYAGGAISVIILVALFVTLIPTTIGALLSAIGIAGMDRLIVPASSGTFPTHGGLFVTPPATEGNSRGRNIGVDICANAGSLTRRAARSARPMSGRRASARQLTRMSLGGRRNLPRPV